MRDRTGAAHGRLHLCAGTMPRMVLLILTRPGFDDAVSRIDARRDAVWINAGILSDAEVRDLRAAGWDLTTFAHPLDLTDLESDLDTIREHHPGRVVWAETVLISN